MGIYIIFKAFHKKIFHTNLKNSKIMPLAFFGGLCDAIGGGGWGPIVTTSLLSNGYEPKKAIGSVNSSEFFITLFTGFSLAIIAKITNFEIVLGLILGGVFVAPFAAKITTLIPAKKLMLIVGLLISSLSAFTIYQTLFPSF
jgi:uncharacterized membrane protein YfcA